MILTWSTEYSTVEAIGWCVKIGLKHGSSCINVREVLREMLTTKGKPELENLKEIRKSTECL